MISLPPKPNALDASRRSHLGGCLRESVPDCEELDKLGKSKISVPSSRGAGSLGPPGSSFVDWIEWMPTVPSKKAVANMSGLRGHQSTWKAQLLAEGSYVTRDQRQGVGYKFISRLTSPITSEV